MGGTHRTATASAVVGRRARTGGSSRRAVARAGAVTGAARLAPPARVADLAEATGPAERSYETTKESLPGCFGGQSWLP